MELDLIDSPIDLKATTPREIEEVFEDPFAMRFIPDSIPTGSEPRYYLIGMTVTQRHLFVCFNTDGKKAQIFAARECSDEESKYYERNYQSYQ